MKSGSEMKVNKDSFEKQKGFWTNRGNLHNILGHDVVNIYILVVCLTVWVGKGWTSCYAI